MISEMKTDNQKALDWFNSEAEEIIRKFDRIGIASEGSPRFVSAQENIKTIRKALEEPVEVDLDRKDRSTQGTYYAGLLDGWNRCVDDLLKKYAGKTIRIKGGDDE